MNKNVTSNHIQVMTTKRISMKQKQKMIKNEDRMIFFIKSSAKNSFKYDDHSKIKKKKGKRFDRIFFLIRKNNSKGDNSVHL